MNKTKKMGVLLLLLVLIFTSCAGDVTINKKTLKVAIDKTFTTLHPQISNVLAEKEVMGQFMEGLMGYDDQNNLVGLGAESVNISEDGKIYTFSLRKDSKWANGDAITALDYHYAWQLLVQNEKAAFNTLLAYIQNGTDVLAGNKTIEELGVTVIDEYHLEVTLAEPYNAFLDMITSSTFYPLHEKTYEQYGDDGYGVNSETTMSNGAYILKSYTMGDEIVLEKNPLYWDAQNVDIDVIEIKVIPELITQSILFDNQELDIIRIQGELADIYTDEDNVISGNESRLLYMYLSNTIETDNHALQNKNFRNALAYAIDKNILTEQIMKDGSRPQEGLFPHDFIKIEGKDYRDLAGTHNEPIYNIQQAQAYLQEAKTELGLETIEFTFMAQDMTLYRKIFENIKAQVETNLPGVTMNLKLLPNQLYFPELLKHQTPAAMVTWSATYVDYQNFTDQFATDSTYNLGNYENTHFTELLELARNEADVHRQMQLYSEAEDILIADGSYLPLMQLGSKYKTQSNISHIYIQPVAPTILYKYIKKG